MPEALKVIDVVHRGREAYDAKDFDEQESYMLSLGLGPKRLVVEVGVYLHWRRKEAVDLAVDLSCMSGCIEKCKFCAAAETSGKALSADQIVAQLREALGGVRRDKADFLAALGNRPKVTVSFEGMGEPSLLAPVVCEAIAKIRNEFGAQFALQVLISTMRPRADALESWAKLEPPLHSLQVSLHGVDDVSRAEVVPNAEELQKILVELAKFRKASPSTEVKINYLLLRDLNDSLDHARQLCDLLKETDYFLKISRLNETGASRKNELLPSRESDFAAFLEHCRVARDPRLTYPYGTRAPIGVSCGQLAAWANPELPEHTRILIAQAHRVVTEGQAALFLGAGASRSAWDAPGLAHQLYADLEPDRAFRGDPRALGDVADMYDARQRRGQVVGALRERLKNSRYPEELKYLSMYPWQAIFTTNYDQFLEQAYIAAREEGITRSTLNVIVEDGDLVSRAPRAAIPLIKLHGCIDRSPPEQIVISGGDYLVHYQTRRSQLFKLFETEAMRHDLVFIGYSLRDQYVRQLLSSLKSNTRHARAAYAVLPIADLRDSIDASRRLLEDFRVTLIPATGEQFIDEFRRLSRRPVALVSGSNRPRIGPDGEIRPDMRSRINELAGFLGEGLSQQGVRIVTGATARDKFGYLVGASADRSVVTTYVWNGIKDQEDGRYGDEVGEMINVQYFGTQAGDVIEKTLDMAQIVIVVGGSFLTLEEFRVAFAQDKLIIPVACGSDAYASDVIHTFLSRNRSGLAGLASDEAGRKKAGRPWRVTDLLTAQDLQLLRLNENKPSLVAETILEIIRQWRMRYTL